MEDSQNDQQYESDLRDALRFSISDDGNGPYFEWLYVNGHPDGDKVNEVLGDYFSGRYVSDVDFDDLTNLLRKGGPAGKKLARIVNEYCRYLS